MSHGTRSTTRAVAATDLLNVGQAPALALGQQYLATAQARALLFANMVGDQQRGFLMGSALLRRTLRGSGDQGGQGDRGGGSPQTPDNRGPTLRSGAGPVVPPAPAATTGPQLETPGSPDQEPEGDLEARLAELLGLTGELYEEVPRGFRKVRRDVRDLDRHLALYGRPVVT